MIDIINELKAIQRTVRDDDPESRIRSVILTRTYDADIDDVWDAVTNPDRIARWFMPITGELSLGGRYQLEGNAGGEILKCEPPRMFRVSWVYGDPQPGDFSEVEVRLRAISAGQTRLDLEHTAKVDDDRWGEYGPGAVGVGWDGGILGLSLHLQGQQLDEAEKMAWAMGTSAEARQFMTESSNAWGVAFEAAGADPAAVEKAVAATTAFYVPPAE